MADEQFRGEDTVDEEGLNATQRRAQEEGSIWKDVGPAGMGDDATRDDARSDDERQGEFFTGADRDPSRVDPHL